MGLRKGQKELVNQYRGGYCAISAIPGGGKTHCLSLWAVEMIAKKLHKPGKILIVTYMNTAVNNFKQRISKELLKHGIIGSKNYFVSTIHGLCLQIIKAKPDAVLVNEDFRIADEVSKIGIVSKAIDEWKKRNPENFEFYIDTKSLSVNKLPEIHKKWHDRLCSIILGIIGDLKCRGIKPREAKKLCKKLDEKSILRWATDIYEIYDRNLKALGMLDFDDMLYNAKKMLLEDEALLNMYRNKYTYVCEDEAQDSNLIQSEILNLIADGNLLRVGDSNQAICGSFSNSDFRLFKDFCNMEQTTTYGITQSSRNTREIINVANHFVDYVRDKHPLELCRESLLPQYIEPVADDDEMKNPETLYYGIDVNIYKSWEDEVKNVVINAYKVKEAHPEKTIAILVPSSWKMNFVIALLEKSNIEYEELSNTSSERNKSLRSLGRMLDFVASPDDSIKFAAMVSECLLTENYEDGNMVKNLELETETGNTIADEKSKRDILIEFLERYQVERLLYPVEGEIDIRNVPKEVLELKAWHDFCDKLDTIKDILEFPMGIVEKLILYISEKLEFGREERAIAQKVAGDVRYIMEQDPDWTLEVLAGELLNPKNIFSFFAGIVWELKGYQPKPGIITVCTYHKSKGLEWDTVFLTALSNDDFPVGLNDRFMGEYWYLKQKYKNPQAYARAEMRLLMNKEAEFDSITESKIETISERARLLYVGITRAKHYLYMSGYEANKGRRMEVKPSEYLLELKSYIEKERKNWKRT